MPAFVTRARMIAMAKKLVTLLKPHPGAVKPSWKVVANQQEKAKPTRHQGRRG